MPYRAVAEHVPERRSNARADLGRVPLTKTRLDAPVERLTFAIGASGGDVGVVEMTWETTKVSVPVRVAR